MEVLDKRWEATPEWAPAGPASLVATQLVIYRAAVADFAEQIAALSELLTPEERARAARYLRSADRARYVVGRAGLRRLLGQHLEQPPSSVPLTLNAFGKPHLPAPANVQFNLAHSGEWVVLALGAREVGIDVEKWEPDFPFADVAAHRFSAAEQRCLAQSADPRAAFYTLWTRQEAQAKATGRGLSDASGGTEEVGWTTRGFEVAPGYPGAVAYPADWQPAVCFFTLEP